MSETVKVVVECPCCNHLLEVTIQRQAGLLSGFYKVNAKPYRKLSSDEEER